MAKDKRKKKAAKKEKKRKGLLPGTPTDSMEFLQPTADLSDAGLVDWCNAAAMNLVRGLRAAVARGMVVDMKFIGAEGYEESSYQPEPDETIEIHCSKSFPVLGRLSDPEEME